MFDRHAHVKKLWQAKLDRQITDSAYFVGRFLVRMADRGGRAWPSLQTIADGIGRSVRTVSRAIDLLSSHGLLSWVQREGTRHRRASNLYTLGQKVREKPLESSSARVSNGPLPEGVRAALERLGRVLGCPAGRVMPWLAT